MPTTKALLLDAAGTSIHPRVPIEQTYWEAGKQFGSRRSQESLRHRFSSAFRELFGSTSLEPPAHHAPADHAPADRPPADRPPADRSSIDEQDQRRRWFELVSRVFDDVADASELFEYLWDYYARPAAWQVDSDLESWWWQWRTDGWSLGIASNFDSRLQRIVEKLPPLDRFDHLFWSGDLHFEKPDPRFFTQIEQRLNLSPSQLLMVGDNLENDYLGPRRAGWSSILLDPTGKWSANQEIEMVSGLAQLIRHPTYRRFVD